jgi:hypothetical protein
MPTRCDVCGGLARTTLESSVDTRYAALMVHINPAVCAGVLREQRRRLDSMVADVEARRAVPA